MFEYALVSGLTASGADAFLMHVTTTPSVAYIVRTDEFDCGIMISASHNPFYDNGIKILDNKGHKMNNEVEKRSKIILMVLLMNYHLLEKIQLDVQVIIQ